MNQIGIGGLPSRGYTNSLPYFSISGVTGNAINLLNPVNDGHAQLADNLSWIAGRHAMKFGVEEVSWFDDRFQPNTSGNPILGSLLVHGRIHGQCLRRFPAGIAAIGDAHGTIPAAVYSFPRLGGLRAGRFQSHSAAHPDVRAALRIQRSGVYTGRQYLFVRPGNRQDRDPERRGQEVHQRAVPLRHDSARDRRSDWAWAVRCARAITTISRRASDSPSGWTRPARRRCAADGASTTRTIRETFQSTMSAGPFSVTTVSTNSFVQRPAAIHAGESVRHSGLAGNAGAGGRGAQPAQQLRAAIQPLHRARS